MGIKVQDLTYLTPGPRKVPLLHNLNFCLEAGKVTLIAGRTGSGKSTLLNVLAGLKSPAAGQVFFQEQPLWIKGNANNAVFRDLGLVSQYPEHQFFLPTVREELLYSLKYLRLNSSERQRRLKEIVQFCNLREELMERSPFLLSGGEKRKVALASVFIGQPSWLLLDEPSSGMDSQVASWLIQQLENMKAEKLTKGIIIVSHDLDLFLPIADSVVLLKDGEFLGSWTPEDLAKSPETLVEAGIAVPACLKLASQLVSLKLLEGPHCRMSLQATDIGDGLAKVIARGKTLSINPAWQSKTLWEETSYIQSQVSTEHKSESFIDVNPFARLDPRSKWLVYVLFSIVVLMKGTWPVIGISIVITLIIAKLSKIPQNQLNKPLIPMGLFMLMAFGISGIQISMTLQPFKIAGIHFAWHAAWQTLELLAPFLPVLVGGAVFAYSTSPMSMKKGLESFLTRIPGFAKGAEIIAFTTALMFRFINLIPAEIERFSLLAATRGNKNGRVGKLRLRQLPAFITPLLLSILQFAEDLSIAIEVRGYGKTRKKSYVKTLHWQSIDWYACLVGLSFSGLLLAVGWLW